MNTIVKTKKILDKKLHKLKTINFFHIFIKKNIV